MRERILNKTFEDTVDQLPSPPPPILFKKRLDNKIKNHFVLDTTKPRVESCSPREIQTLN